MEAKIIVQDAARHVPRRRSGSLNPTVPGRHGDLDRHQRPADVRHGRPGARGARPRGRAAGTRSPRDGGVAWRGHAGSAGGRVPRARDPRRDAHEVAAEGAASICQPAARASRCLFVHGAASPSCTRTTHSRSSTARPAASSPAARRCTRATAPTPIRACARCLRPPRRASLADAYVAVSEETAALARAEHDARQDKISVIRNGIDLGRFDPARPLRAEVRRELDIPEDAWVVGTVGRVVDEKNRQSARTTRPLCAAWRAPRDRRRRWRSCPRCAAQGVGETPRMHLLGVRRDAPRVLQAFDVFCMSSRSEGLPLVILEAMASALPIVSTAVGGIPNVISDDGADSGCSSRRSDSRRPRSRVRCVTAGCADRAVVAARAARSRSRGRARRTRWSSATSRSTRGCVKDGACAAARA